MKEYKQVIQNWQTNSKQMYFDASPKSKFENLLNEDYKEINTIWFTNKDLEKISYRTINYWDSKGYLTGEQNAGGKWRKFDFYQLIWIQLLDKFRELGVSHEVVVPAIFNAFGYVPIANDKDKEKILNNLEKHEKEVFKQMYGNFSNFQNTFRFYVSYACLAKTPFSIIYNANGNCCVIKGIDEKSSAEEVKTYINNLNKNESFVSISLNELIKEFIITKEAAQLQKLGIITEEEEMILNYIRKEGIKEVKITLDNGKPVTLEIKDTFNEKDLNKRVYEYMLAPYQNLEFKIQGNDNAYVERTIKRKI